MSELKRNITFSLILTGSRFLFPIITYPYVARVLGPDKMGILNFSESYAAYFILIAAIGIPLYGVREIAKVKDDQNLLNKVFSEISFIYLISTFVCLIGFLISIALIPQLKENLNLNLLFGLNILFTFLSVEWFFIGIEKFKYIATRSIITKLIPVVLMFFLVKEENDYIKYQVLSTLAFLANSFINIYFLRKYVRLSFTSINIKRHIPPLLNVFVSSIFISFYSLIDTLVLGFLYNYSSVGYYSAAVKLNRVMGMIVASIGNVMFPRISNIINSGDKTQLMQLLNKSIHLTVFVTIPLVSILYLLSEDIVVLLFGVEFKSSILPAQILSPMVIFMGLSNVYYWQILLPFSKEKLLLKLFLSITVISLVFNLILASQFDYLGSAIATVSVEFILLVLSIRFSQEAVALPLPWKHIMLCLLISLIFIPVVFIVKTLFDSYWIILCLSGLSSGLIYFGIQFFIVGDPIARDSISLLKGLLKRQVNSSK